ncbi:trypsin-like peptidase domain-containing protein [Chitinophaga filiformis]|uniref:trypsin-like peptidase domain-containing protein n=1 Tax=Chitinophaga filiformis TaxID=104663 RepID=UPI001F3FFCEB|nr:trypsin-like peptidase domain-containing protein [Chitinophaga filiformis]MCF6404990.1 trypsin-like peptidase domain-containing protein [Chitinophaga filiformis]
MRKNQLFVILLLLLAGDSYSQRIAETLPPIIHAAIEKAYPASVRIWGYDTVSNQQMSAQFSGVVVTREGHILTVAHTTIPGKTYKVTFPDGKAAIALALGKINFPETPILPDVAMMKIISSGEWTFAAMGRSADLKVNEPCISIAYPESLNQPLPAVRFGRITQVRNDKGFVQSSCIMEPGDSGGPLFDYMGRVIGLHSAVDISESINYEVPVDLYRKYWTALNKAEHYTQFPAAADTLMPDPLAASLLTVPELEDMNAALKTTAYNGLSLKVISRVDGVQQTILGTLFSVRGQSAIISKSSAVGEAPFVIVNNKQLKATVRCRDRSTDLVWLELASPLKKGITLRQSIQAPDHPGEFLLSPQPDTMGIASVLGSKEFSLPRMTSFAFLGAAIAPTDGPLVLTIVQPGSPAGESGLQAGDLVLSINRVPIRKAEDYGRELSQYWAGDKIVFEGQHNGTVYTKEIVLGTRPQQPASHPAEMFPGGKSSRRDGFESVFSHDAILRPEQCGGPVFDMLGQFYGINIARFSRTSSLVIPAAIVKQFIISNLYRRNS